MIPSVLESIDLYVSKLLASMDNQSVSNKHASLYPELFYFVYVSSFSKTYICTCVSVYMPIQKYLYI